MILYVLSACVLSTMALTVLHKGDKKIYRGEIAAVSADKLEICLHEKPKKIKVRFKKKSKNVPCNVKEYDLLYSTVTERDGKYYVEIYWEVFDKTTIEYKITC